MSVKNIKYILTDIEGTTTSVKFVYDILFPYFNAHIKDLKSMTHLKEVQQAFRQTVDFAKEFENKKIDSVDEIIQMLEKWSSEDKKITPLKTLQGILWDKAYQSGEIKGHVYTDVPQAFETWKEKGLEIGIFSSGSVAAQKLIFGYSEAGDLRPFLSDYFDTNTGGKRDVETYLKISNSIGVSPENILFLSDIVEELEAADKAGFQTIQLLRDGIKAQWNKSVSDFKQITFV